MKTENRIRIVWISAVSVAFFMGLSLARGAGKANAPKTLAERVAALEKSAVKSTDMQNLEQLTIEFADELAFLNVKVSKLEKSAVKSTDLQNLEQLTIEFADELAFLNVKVSKLEKKIK